MKNFHLYAQIALYLLAGINHFIVPDFYLSVMPSFMPFPSELVFLSGLSEMLSAVLIYFKRTRKWGVYFIVAQLILFLVLIHLPMSIDFYQNNKPGLWLTVLRLPLQFILMYWVLSLIKQ